MNGSESNQTLRCQCHGYKKRIVDAKVCRIQATYIFTVFIPSTALLIFSGMWVFISNEIDNTLRGTSFLWILALPYKYPGLYSPMILVTLSVFIRALMEPIDKFAFFFMLSVGSEEYNRIIKQDIPYRKKIVDLGKFIVALDTERSSTIGFVTSRTYESQSSLKQNLDLARQTVNHYLLNIQSEWPNNELLAPYGQAFRSPRLFNAVLHNHRLRLNNENRFWEELDFFTKAVEAMLSWMIRLSLGSFTQEEIGMENIYKWIRHVNLQSQVPRWLISHSYLLASLNYLGAEQALCNAFNSVVCFSRAESFAYANISFSGEAMFHMFRLSYPNPWPNSARIDEKDDHFKFSSWKIRPHSSIFPQLHECRQEVMSNADYAAVGIDPSLCDYGRKNESNLKEVDIILFTELQNLYKFAETEMETIERKAQKKVYFSIVVMSCLSCYVGIINCLKLTCLIKKLVKKRKTFSKVKKKKRFSCNKTLTNVCKDNDPRWCGPYLNQNIFEKKHHDKRKSVGEDSRWEEEKIYFKMTDIFNSSEVGSNIGLFSIFNNAKNSSMSYHQPSREVLTSTSPTLTTWHQLSSSGSKSQITLYPSLKLKV